MALTAARRVSLLAYCRIEEPDTDDLLTLEGAYAAAVGYLAEIGVGEPPEGAGLRSIYDLVVNAMVLDSFDQRGSQVQEGKLMDNPVFRRNLVLLKLSGPVSNLDTLAGGT